MSLKVGCLAGAVGKQPSNPWSIVEKGRDDDDDDVHNILETYLV